ncbi:hypothetical protein [Deferrisoma camini]|uniref:hypothetical protein n=1 Tax=Deferrisoma camini TaxID=1035120 RepID=UPI00046D4BFE|nr:hypothetical protein [Deferrisoma camini]
MLVIGKPVEIRRVFEVDGESFVVTYPVRPPGKALWEEILEAKKKAEESGDTDAVFWTPERLAPYLSGNLGGVTWPDGSPIRPTIEHLRRLEVEAPSIYAGAIEAVYAAAPRKAEADRKNSKTSSAGISATAPSTAGHAD